MTMKYRWCGDHEDDTFYQSGDDGANVDNESISLSMDCTTLPLPNNKYSPKHAVNFIAQLRSVQLKHLLVHRRRFKRCSCKTIVFLIVTVALVYMQLITGIFQRCFLERDFRTEFSFEQDIDNFHEVVQRCVDQKTVSGDFHPPPNMQYANIPFLVYPQLLRGTNESVGLGLLVIVKSATKNVRKRMAIRKTWASPLYLKENMMAPDLPTKVVFLCGAHNISEMEKHYDDLVIADFIDSYSNNTYKTILSTRWAVEYVRDFKYLMIVDDDMYISIKNVLTFLHSIPTTHVQAVTSSDSGATVFYPVNQLSNVCSSNLNISLADKPLIMGQVIVDAKPFRSTIGMGSTWSMSIKDYPFTFFAPYIAGGATLFDSKTVSLLYTASFFTKFFWIDDVYIGILAHKLGITLTNNNLMHSSYNLDSKRREFAEKFNDMIALHGLECPEQLEQLWESRNLESLDSCHYLFRNLWNL